LTSWSRRGRKRLQDAAKGAEETVNERLEACGKLETELRRRTMHVNRKTKEVDLVNCKYKKMLASRAPDGSGTCLVAAAGQGAPGQQA
jgi:hypothetical protein